MNQDGLKTLQYGLASLSRWMIPLAIVFLLGSAGLGWLLKSFLILVGLMLITPVVVFLGFRWWLKRNLIQAVCPVCTYEFVSLNHTQCSCPNCNEPLRVEQGIFHRATPPGTIDVAAVEVQTQALDQ